MSGLESIFKVIKLTNDFRRVRRTINVVGENRLENDSEHSYQLAILAWYLIESNGWSLDKDLAIKYCLIHDLTEVYAGDVDPHTANRQEKEAKALREAEAAKMIEERLPECPSISMLIQQYEKKKDPESKFVYALDKIQPILNVFLDSGDYYHKYNVTFEKWFDYNRDKISVSPEVTVYFEELVKFLETRKELFAPEG